MTKERVEEWLNECSDLVKDLCECKLMDDKGIDRFAGQISIHFPEIQIVGLLEVADIMGFTTSRVDNSHLGQDYTYPIQHSFRYNGVKFTEVMTKEEEKERLAKLKEVDNE
jgi:hypothetical protein